MPKSKKLYTGRQLPVSGRDYNLIDLLINYTRYPNRKGEIVTMFTPRQNVVRFEHLWNEEHRTANGI